MQTHFQRTCLKILTLSSSLFFLTLTFREMLHWLDCHKQFRGKKLCASLIQVNVSNSLHDEYITSLRYWDGQLTNSLINVYVLFTGEQLLCYGERETERQRESRGRRVVQSISCVTISLFQIKPSC